MTWSSGPPAAVGAAATFPSEQPPLVGNTGVTYAYSPPGVGLASFSASPAQPLTFRRDPVSKIVYVSGSWTVTTTAQSSTQYSLVAAGYVLPAAFRPLHLAHFTMRVWADQANPVDQLWWVNAAGALQPAIGQPSSQTVNYTATGLYLSDV